MPSCVINCCKNNSCFEKKASGITFHKFPADKTWKKNWIKTIRNNRDDNEWLPSKFSVVCSSHFEEVDMYNTKGGYRRLKKNATPKKIDLVDSEWCQEMEASGSSIISNPKSSTLGPNTEPCNIDEEVDAAGTVGDKSDKEVSNHQPEIRDSDLESIFDTPKKHKLRQQAKKYKLYYQVHTRKIKTLNQKIKRLIKKNTSLKTVVKDLKHKNNIDTDVFNLLGENSIAAEICHNINTKNRGKKKIKYSSAMRKFCLTLNLYSPKAYEYVRQIFQTCLPHTKTLAKLAKNAHINGEPGFTEETFTAVRHLPGDEGLESAIAIVSQ